LLTAMLAACKGPAGQDGTNGTNGTNGVDGLDGANGTNGTNGTDGTDGTNGTTGTNGADGRDGRSGDGPWGVNLEILSVDGASGADGQFEPGDVPVVTYTLTDDNGTPYDTTDMTGIRFQIAGPNTDYQIVVNYADLDVVSNSVWNSADQTWTYTYETPIPDVYQATTYDTPDIGEDRGDLSGLPLVDGTYRLAGMAYKRFYRQDGTSYYDASNTTWDFLEGAATALSSHQVVLQENCQACHGDAGVLAHGGSRYDVTVCVTCHVAGLEDRYSNTDSSVTPMTTFEFKSMIHKIHMGDELADGYMIAVQATDPAGEGYPDYNLENLAEGIAFPRWPMGPATCAACHDGAPEADNIFSAPSRTACGACHDTVNFETGENHSGGVQTSDANCSICHLASSIQTYHEDPRTDTTITSGLNVAIVSVTGGSGPDGQLEVGDTPTVAFTLTDDDGNAISTADLGSATVVLSGPVDHMQWIYESSSGSVVSNATWDSGLSAWTFTLTSAIPDVFPAQKNDTSDIGYAQGDWNGLPLVSGTYRIGVMAYTNVVDTKDVTWRDGQSSTMDVLFGEDTERTTHDAVFDANCQQCHGTLEFHGKSREGLSYCLQCHTDGAEDRNSSTDPSSTPGTSIAFRSMIHKIHNGSNLTKTFDVVGYSGTSNFNDIVFPRFDGGTKDCLACHEGSDLWQTPQTVACTSCHDADDVAAHAAIMTDETYGESCNVCHGPGTDFAVETVHDWLR